jgi:hypothetical protein
MNDKNKPLLIICAHVDSESKKNFLIQNLKELKNENIDVCLSTHSTMFLDELSNFVKYVIYDANNYLITKQDYIDNSDLLDSSKLSCIDVFGLGYSITHDSFSVIDNIPGSPHSRSALSLFKNGLILAKLNSYKWVVYLEYDIQKPKFGFKKFIEEKIESLIKLNKKCFYYLHDFKRFLWGGLFICDTETICENEKLFKTNWDSKRDWISCWKLGFFESIIEFAFEETYTSEQIERKIITEDCYNIWDINSYHDLNNFIFSQPFSTEKIKKKLNLTIGIYPYFDDGYRLFFHVFNSNDFTINVNNIIIKKDDIVFLDIPHLPININSWFIQNIPIIDLNGTIDFTYEVSIDEQITSFSEKFDLKNIKNVYNNLSRIEFKK